MFRVAFCNTRNVFSINATTHISQDMLCLPYAGFPPLLLQSLKLNSKDICRNYENEPAVQPAGQTFPDATAPIGKVHPFSKIAITFELIHQFRCPSRFRIPKKKKVNIVCFMTESTIFNPLGLTAP